MTEKFGGHKRVSLACEECRARRSRCGGEQPSCSSCTQKNIRCEYRYGENKRKPPSKRYVESLQARIAVLEGQLEALGQKVVHLEMGQVDNVSGDGTSESVLNRSTDNERSKSSSPVALRDPIDEITQRAGRLNIGEDGQLRYFGAQSNYHLLHTPIYNETTKSIENLQNAGLATAALLGKRVEASPELQDHLLGLYWRWQNPWLYMIHKASFMQDYKNGGIGAFCSPLLLSAIFALSSRYSDRIEVRSDPADPHSAGNNFAEQAKVLLLYESEAPTITTVQAASLLSLRWMSENKESLGWLYIGMATRMAYNLGLNLDCSEWVTSGMITEQDAEVRRITWWGCYKLDKLYCLGLGRPGTTRTCDITCRKPNLEPDVEFEPWVPWGERDEVLLGAHARTVSAMNYSCDHLTLISEPLETLYAPGNKLTESEAERIVGQADVAFNAFYNSLPSHLRLPSSPRTPCLPHIYQLHIQFHVMQIQLHRSLIRRRFTHSHTSFPTEEDVHLKACRKSATEITRILRMYTYHYTLRLTPVVTVVNTFSAAVIHLMDAASSDEELRRSALRNLRICVPSMDTMAMAWMWSRRALRAFRLLAHEWLIPQAVTLAMNGEPVSQPTLGHEQPAIEQELTEPPPCPEGVSSGLGPFAHHEDWILGSADTTQGLSSDREPKPQQAFASVFDPSNPGLDFEGTDWLFDVDAVGQLSGEFTGIGQNDPWFSGALPQLRSSESAPWLDAPEPTQSAELGWPFLSGYPAQGDFWTA